MTADVELLPLPDDGPYYDPGDMQEYARANVAHATAAKDAEIEALRAEAGLLRHGGVAYSQQVADLIGRAGCAEARVDRLAEALRGLRGLMLEQVRWEPCDCGCPQQRKPDGPHSVTWLRAAQRVELAISKAEDRG